MKEVDTLRLSPSTPPPPSPSHTWRPHMYVGSGHGRPEGGKVIAGIQLMVDALVGLPQLLLDHAPARIAHTSRWPNPVGHHRNLAEVQTTHTQRLLGPSWAAGSRRACGNRAAEMIPDTEAVCQTSETAVDTSGETYEKIKDRPEKEVASVTAWKRYQRLVAAMESQGGEFNRKSLIEAIFRGSDLVYASH